MIEQAVISAFPVSWPRERLGNLTWVRARLGWKGLTADEYVDSGIPMLSTPNIKGAYIDFASANRITVQRYEESPEIKLRVGDVLLTKDGSTIGIANIVRSLPEPATVNGSIAVLTPNERLEAAFLLWLLQTNEYQALMRSWQDGMGVPHLFQSDIKRIPLALPSTTEQRAIADYLDRETAQIDAFIAKNEELAALLTERRSAEISRAISGNWPEVQLRTLSTVPIQNGVDAIGDSSNPQEWPRYVRTTDIANVSSLDEEKRVTIAPRLASGGMLAKDDLLLTRAGATIGKSYLHTSGEVASYAGYLVRVRPDRQRVLPWYLAYWTQSQEYRDQIRSGAVVSTIENFSASKYRALRVPLPPIAVQEEVVGRVRRSSESTDRAVGMAINAIELARERRAALISAAVTGKTDVGVTA